MESFTPVVKGQGIGYSSACDGDARGRPGLLRAFAVNLVAGHAGYRRLIGESGANDAPRSFVFRGCTRSRIEPLKYMPWQRRQSSISMRLELCAGSVKIWLYVALCGPACQFAYSCWWHVLQLEVIASTSTSRRRMALRNRAEDVNPHVAQLGGQAGLMAIHAARCRGAASCMHHADIGGHFVTACAALAVLRRVVIRRAIGAADCKQDRQPYGDSANLKNRFMAGIPCPSSCGPMNQRRSRRWP